MTTPDRPTCERCPAVRAAGFNRCLIHLESNELDQFLNRLGPGSDLDARGTTISAELLSMLEDAVDNKFGRVDFTKARFTMRSAFAWVEAERAVFEDAEFEAMEEFGPLTAKRVDLRGAVFAKWLWIETDSERLLCFETNFVGGASLRVCGGSIDAAAAIFGPRSSIIKGNRPRDLEQQPMLTSLEQSDVSSLVIVDMDLSLCMFSGTDRLDQIRLEGKITFSGSKRQVLFEEAKLAPERVAGLYRSLRKAFEDSKNEAGAGDFYYGEMEMRRRAPSTRRAEKLILWAYWLLSGYGQRATRAVAALGVLVATVCVLLFTVGLPGAMVWTGARVDQALRIGTGAVVFRDAGQALTSAGNWTVMVARFAGPVLLALAVLAVRARVKR